MFGQKKSKGTLLRLKIGGMHCTSCTMTIDDTLEELAGIFSSATNYATATTTVQYDPTVTNPDAVIAAIVTTGYSASVTE